MKKAVRIFILTLALTLLCTSVAFAAPDNLRKIEGLPEMPAVPTMTTASDGDTETVTLSEPLAYLNAVCNWQFVPVQFDADGLVGTVSLDFCKQQKTILGVGKCSYAADWVNGSESDWSRVGGVWVNKGEDADQALNKTFDEMSANDPLRTSTTHQNYQSWEPDENGDWHPAVDEEGNPKLDPHTVEYHGPEYYMVQPIEQEYGTWYNVVPTSDKWGWGYGTYEINGYGMAFEGATKDGVIVRFDRRGRCMEAIVQVKGANFLASDKTPVKTEVYFEFVEPSGASWRWIIRSIKETYADGSSEHVKYAYNGSYDGHVR